MNDLTFVPAHELATMIRQRHVSSVEVLEAHLAQITQHNPAIHAIVTLDEDGARQRAKAADVALGQGQVWGPLHGVPITLEDAHPTAGLRSTWGGFAPFSDHVPTEDGCVVARLKTAGAIVMGKTHGPAIWGADSVFAETNNPWDRERTPGGSSAGPGAAVAAGLTPLDIGLNSMGSIQNPAHYCGVYGMRPTEHRVPMTGVLFIDTIRKFRILSVAGPMARSLEDLRLALQVIAGPDGHDTHVPQVPWREAARPDIRKLRVAWTSTFPGMPAAHAIQSAIETLAHELERMGAHVEQCLPEVNFAEQLGLAERIFGMLAGTFQPRPEGTPPVSLEDYLLALDQRDAFIAAWEKFFGRWDVFLGPAGPRTAERRSDTHLTLDGAELSEDQEKLLEIPYALSPVSGCPMVVVPAGLDQDGLPFGAQLMGHRWEDERLLAIAELISEVTGGFRRPPGY